jgi:hypothetical protein
VLLSNILLITISQLLKKPEKGEDPTTEKPKARLQEVGIGDEKLEPLLRRPESLACGEPAEVPRRREHALVSTTFLHNQASI